MALFVFLLFSSLPSLIFSYPICLSSITKLPLPVGSASPTSISFSPNLLDDGPYCSCSDGRILKYNYLTQTFQGFSYTSPNRDASFCDNTNIVDRMPTCGVPAGQGFNSSGDLFVTDDYYGLTSVGPYGGQATILEGVPPIHLSTALDVDVNGIVRFTDASTIATAHDLITGVGFPEGDNTGSLYEYDPSNRQLNLLINQNLSAPVGLATDLLATYVLLTSDEKVTKRVLKYWLKGENAGNIEVIANLTGLPRKIKRNEFGDFWIANNVINTDSSITPLALKINGDGKLLATVDFSHDYDKSINIVTEHKGKLYVGGRNITFVGVYTIFPICL